MMSDRELLALVDDIREHGLREPIWLHSDGRIIDGRNRHLACTQLGIEPDVRTFAGGDDDLVGFVLSLNLQRRHLSESQRGMVAARVAGYSHGGDRASEQAANLPLATQAEAAALLNVSPRTVRAAKKVQQQGGPELAALVDAGEVAVSTAAAVAEEVKEKAAGVSRKEARSIFDAAAKKRKADLADAAALQRDLQKQHQLAQKFKETAEPSVIAHVEEVGRRLDAVARIADGCDRLMDLVDGIDPERAVREAHEQNRGRLEVVHAAIAFLNRVADAMTLEVTTV